MRRLREHGPGRGLDSDVELSAQTNGRVEMTVGAANAQIGLSVRLIGDGGESVGLRGINEGWCDLLLIL